MNSIDRPEIAFNAVQIFLKDHDFGPLYSFVCENNFLLDLRSGDVDHSREVDLKQSFISTIASVSNVDVENDFELKTTYESGKICVFSADLVIPSSRIHVEFKNLMLDELVLSGKMPSTYDKKKNSWEEGKKFSLMIAESGPNEVNSIQLRESSDFNKKFTKNSKGNHLDRDLKTVKDVWDNLVLHTRKNKDLVEEKLNVKVASFAVLRIGLNRVHSRKIE
jgi:hypothetical protein